MAVLFVTCFRRSEPLERLGHEDGEARAQGPVALLHVEGDDDLAGGGGVVNDQR